MFASDISTALWGFMLETVLREQDSCVAAWQLYQPLSLSSRIQEKKRRMKVTRPVDMHKIAWSPCCYRQFLLTFEVIQIAFDTFFLICSDKGKRYNVLPLVLELAIVISRVAVTFFLKGSPVALWCRLQLIGLWFANVTQHYKTIPHQWKRFHLKLTNCKRFAGLWLKHHWETPHICSRAEATNVLLVLPPWLLDAVVDLRICQWMSLWLKNACCSNGDAGIRVDTSLNKKLWGIFEMCGRATHIRCSAVSKSTLELHFHRTEAAAPYWSHFKSLAEE